MKDYRFNIFHYTEVEWKGKDDISSESYTKTDFVEKKDLPTSKYDLSSTQNYQLNGKSKDLVRKEWK